MYLKESTRLLILLLVLVGTLTACGGQDESETPPKEAATVEAIQPSAQVEAAPTVTPTMVAAVAPTATATAETTTKPVELPQVTTVQQAAQLLDLRQLAQPDQTTPVSRAEVGALNFNTPRKVSEVVDFYRSLLAEQGWQEMAGQGYADDTTATLYFTKAGFTVSLSASQMGEGNTSVTLLQHGNVDLGTLPQVADAEAGFAAPNTLIYLSPSSVVDVARFTRNELAAQGWHEYSPPNSATADSADLQTRTFIQNGLELTAYITTAPAQDNKTSVQYSVVLLPLDLPLASDAAQVQFDKTEPYLEYTSADSPANLADFYRQAMTGLGWTELPDATVTAEQAAVGFANEPAELALQFEATASGGQSRVTLSSFGSPAMTDVSTDTGTAVEADVSGSTAAMPDLPIPEDAQEVAYDPDLAEISFTSPSDIASLVAFYRQGLAAQGWQEDKDYEVVADTFASIDFSQGEDTITLTLFDLNGSIQATVDVSSAPSLAGSTASGDTGSANPTPPADAPTFTINDWPTPPEATAVKLSGETLSYKVALPLVDVAEFYRPTYEMMELDTDCLDTAAEYTSMSCSLSNGNFSLNFFAYESLDNQTEVEISFTNYYYPVDGAESAGASGELTAEEQDGLPLPSDHTGYSDENGQFSRRMTVTSPSDMPTLAEFYQTELPAYGWGLDGSTETGDSTTLTFSGSDGKLTVTLKPSGDETEVLLVNKNTAAATAAGILPLAGQARIYLVNFSDKALTVVINDQTIQVPAGAGMESPETAPTLDLKPNTYQVTTKAGSSSVTDEITVGPDETWTLLLTPEGASPLQMY